MKKYISNFLSNALPAVPSDVVAAVIEADDSKSEAAGLLLVLLLLLLLAAVGSCGSELPDSKLANFMRILSDMLSLDGFLFKVMIITNSNFKY